MPVTRQCELLGVSRSTLYYVPVGVSAEDLAIMQHLDEVYTRWPFYGVRRMRVELDRRGLPANPKRIRRLMRSMGLEAVYPKPRLSTAAANHPVYPYLLRGVRVQRPNQVWASDITYIRLRSGFLYLVAILDWFSRYVISWELSNTADASFCLSALRRALETARPEMTNTDQGSQFTSDLWIEELTARGIAISMDGRGRAFDNIFVERLWRSVKYEEVYLHDYDSPAQAWQGLDRYFRFYNHERPHQSLENDPPAAVYFN
jgi:putative transposase